jgi:hypothetical protein
MNVTSASLAKRLATASLQALCERRPNLGATVKSGVGFTYFESYSEIKSENSEMHQSTAKHPKRGQKGHFYGEPYNLTDCVRAFRILALKDGADPDALYDLAILEEFSDTLPEDATHSVKEEAVKHLSKAIEVAETNPPSSRRDLKKLVIDTPTFIPLYMVNGFKPLASKLLPTPRNLPVQEPIRDPNNSAEVRRKRYFAAKAASEADEIRAGQYGKKYEREWSLYMGGY